MGYVPEIKTDWLIDWLYASVTETNVWYDSIGASLFSGRRLYIHSCSLDTSHSANNLGFSLVNIYLSFLTKISLLSKFEILVRKEYLL